VRSRLLLPTLLLLFSTGCGTSSPPAGPDIRDRLAAIPGLTVTEQATTLAGYRFFVMTFAQPADHRVPTAGQFLERLTLLHRDETAPMILFGSGYFVSLRGARTELSKMVAGNQLSLEHRFFGPSRPDPADWTTLTIEQAAHDYHRIVEAFRPIYRGRWLTTGGSKGGMAAVFHRRFHPDDVEGTVAYSAPLTYAADAVVSPTNRYIVFVDNVGPDPACRQALRDFQRRVLASRAGMLPLLDELAAAKTTTFDQILGKSRAVEFAVDEMPFLFWQYGSAADCAGIPGTTATSKDLFQFLDDVADLYTYSDVDLMNFLPYYHQCATELGYPADREDYLADLLAYPGQDQPPAYLPAGIPTPPYDPSGSVDTQAWVESHGERLLFVYGEYDPWRAGAFELGAARDSFKLVVPAGNHTSRLADLKPADQTIAVDAVSRWSGAPATIPQPQQKPRPAAAPDVEQDPLDLGPRRRWPDAPP
jgi:hypothetical protein